MRVGLVLDHFDRRLGGVEQWTGQLVDYLLDHGHELHIVARGVAASERRDGVTAHELPPCPSRLALADAAADVLKRLDLDVIHDMGLGWYYDVLQPHGGSRRAAELQNLALTPKWTHPFRRLVRSRLPRYRDFDRLCEKQYAMVATDRPARIVVAISEMVRADMTRWHGVDPERIRLIPNGVDINRFTPDHRSEHRAAIRRNLGISDEPIFLMVAHNLRLKGLPALMRAASRLKQAGEPGVVVVVGGKRLTTWKRRAAWRGLSDRIRFVGAVGDPSPYYAAADVYVQPTWYDPCSLVLLEALACGLPVITTRFNGAGELIHPGVHGTILDDPADDLALATAMAGWSSSRRHNMAKRLCRQRMLAQTFEQNAEQFVALYQEIATSGRQPLRMSQGA